MTHNVTEIQQRLITLGYLPATYIEAGATKRNDDGVFGQKSLDALNHYRASQGRGPIGPKVTMEQLNADLFPEDVPAIPAPRSNPINDYLTGLALKAVLPSILKGLFSMFGNLTGFKTIATGAISIAIGVLDIIGWNVPDTGSQTGGMWVAAGLAMIFGRLGLAKVAEDIISNLGK